MPNSTLNNHFLHIDLSIEMSYYDPLWGRFINADAIDYVKLISSKSIGTNE